MKEVGRDWLFCICVYRLTVLVLPVSYIPVGAWDRDRDQSKEGAGHVYMYSRRSPQE